MPNILNIGTSGLQAAKKSLQTTGHNISNVNSEGYSRQRVEQEASNPVSKGGLVFGSGTRIKAVRRYHDKYIENRFIKTNSQKHFHENKNLQLERLQQIFNELNSEGLNNVMGKFFNSFRDLANSPENETIRSVVRDSAELVTQDFKSIRNRLDQLAQDIDTKIETQISDINQIMKHVAELNRKISYSEAVGDNPNDLMDQRDLAIHTLSEFFDLNTYKDNKDQFIVNVDGLGSLVSGPHVQEITGVKVNIEKSSNNMAGSLEIAFKERPSSFFTGRVKDGGMAALIKMRNENIRDTQDHIDKLAFNFINSVNSIHKRGYVLRNVDISNSGSIAESDSKGQTTGLNFFKEISGPEGAAARIDLSDEVKDDITNIATAYLPNSPGDNRVALAISKLQHEKLFADGTATLEDEYLQMVGDIGLKAAKANLNSEQAEGLYNQAKTFKERLTGVSLDEEASNMVRFQHAYEASAKVMQTAKEMMDTLMSIKR